MENTQTSNKTYSYDPDTDTVTITDVETIVTTVSGAVYRNQIANATQVIADSQALIDQANQALGQ